MSGYAIEKQKCCGNCTGYINLGCATKNNSDCCSNWKFDGLRKTEREVNSMSEKKTGKAIKLPLKYDEYGQKIYDADNTLLADIRGWGHFQYFEKGEELQDNFGRMLVNAYNEKYVV